jgi:hypothetical protein
MGSIYRDNIKGLYKALDTRIYKNINPYEVKYKQRVQWNLSFLYFNYLGLDSLDLKYIGIKKPRLLYLGFK